MMLLIGAGMILVGLGFKVAVVPFHMWTPDVYHGAPSSVTAFMSIGAKAGGFAALLRVFLAAFPELSSAWAPLAMWIAALTMAWGNIAAIAQKNIKRMLAYSSIAHAGYIMMALPAASDPGVAPEALRAALFYLLGYAITNLGAWSVVMAMEKAEGTGLAIEDYAGLSNRRPGFALAMALFMLSLTGMPPTVGFIGKFYIFRAAIDADLIWLALVGVITSLISAYYYLRVIVVMYMRAGEPETRSEIALPLSIKTGQKYEIFGALSVHSAAETAFSSKKDIAMLQAMADQLAVIISNDRLYRRTEAKRQLLGVLREIDRQIINPDESKIDVLNFILAESCQLTSAEAGQVFLIEGDELKVEVATEKRDLNTKVPMVVGTVIGDAVFRDHILIADLKKLLPLKKEQPEKHPLCEVIEFFIISKAGIVFL